MDRYPVTNGDFKKMVPGHVGVNILTDKGEPISSLDDQPVIWVNWFEAALFARWIECRLPTEEEWEKAAAWGEGFKEPREYPWAGLGSERAPELCNTSERHLQRTTPVSAHPKGASAYGCEDMAGNVWEWTVPRSNNGTCGVRGGSWDDFLVFARCAENDVVGMLDVRRESYGFRCART